MKDWREIHAAQVAELVDAGWSILAVGVSQDEAVSKSKRRAWPEGAKWFWTSGTIIAPPAKAAQMQEAAA